MLRMFILADDLSGAADSGVACVTAGLSTLVALDSTAADPDAQMLSSEIEALSLDADTRCMDAEWAAREAARLTRASACQRDVLIFKKIDSTLRGHVAHELAAALAAYRTVRGERAIAVVAPAFPAIGRTTIDGVQLAHGQPLHHLDIWRIQGLTGRASIPEMLNRAGVRTLLLPLEKIRSGAKALAGQMNSLALQAEVLVCDAETDQDLQVIAQAGMHVEPRPMWVGSAGLAYRLPAAAGFASENQAERMAVPRCDGPLLFVIGSLSRNSIAQVRALTLAGQATGIQMEPDALLAGNASARWNEYARQLAETIRSGRDVVLSLQPEPQLDLVCRPRLAAALGHMAAAVKDEVGALVASGGETARAVLQCCGVKRLRLLGEFERGVPISMTEGCGRPLPVITKAGDFGRPETLLECAQFLHSDSGSAARKGTQ